MAMMRVLGPKYGIDPEQYLQYIVKSENWHAMNSILYMHTVMPNLKRLGLMTERTEAAVPFPAVEARKWDQFVAVWEEVYKACRGAQTGNCAYAQSKVAAGGDLKIVLHASGSAASLMR